MKKTLRSRKDPAFAPPRESETVDSAPIATGVNTIDTDSTAVSETPTYVGTKTTNPEEDVAMFSKMHAWDPNLDAEKLQIIDEATLNHDTEKEAELNRELLEENSPYPEVVAAVLNTDDPEMPANTIRAWFLGMLFVTLGSGMNLLFSLRWPSITITSIVAQLVSFPAGVFLAKVLPKRQFNTFGLKWSLNPGPFNKKEHALITIMANVSFAGGPSYSTNVLEAMMGFYNINWGFGFAIILTIITQMTGLGLAGLFRSFLVYPSSMIWPSVLPNCALFNTLHEGNKVNDPAETNGWTISRFKYFGYVVLGGFIWYWFPGFLWQGLSIVAWVTWIKPQNAIINQVFGGYSGLSLGAPFTIFTLDWTIITSYTTSPLMTPWFAISNILVGVVIFMYIVTPAISYSGSWYSDHMPLSDSKSYDNTGKAYKVKNILTPEYTLDMEKYKAYSPIFLSTTFALNYGLSFATIIAVVVHISLFHGREIWTRMRSARSEPKDIHRRLMLAYREVPMWWFLAMFTIMVALGFVTVLHWETRLTWWAYIIAILISTAWMIPIGMIYAITNYQIGLNVFTEYVVSYMLPGRPIAMMVFKTLGYITMSQGLTYSQDLKMAQYMKVPPRTVFFGQVIATLWACFVQIGVLFWAFANIDNICDAKQANSFTCPNGRVFFNASIIWGVIGPQRMFAAGSTYGGLQWFWLVGAILPVMIYLVARRFPRSKVRLLNAPLILGGMGSIPPAVPLNYLMWATVGFIFNKHIKNKFRGWWLHYNYITSAALDAGLALCTILIFFAITMTKTEAPKWWGNNVVGSTMDNTGDAVRVPLEPGQTFGPPPGSPGW